MYVRRTARSTAELHSCLLTIIDLPSLGGDFATLILLGWRRKQANEDLSTTSGLVPVRRFERIQLIAARLLGRGERRFLMSDSLAV